MYTYYILLGSNLGDSEALVDKAKRLINMHIGEIITSSPIYKTEPWGEKDQNYFVNQAIRLLSNMTPTTVLSECQRIETYLGKHKITKYGPRLIDIDILLIDDMVISQADLSVPHPKLHERNFVLIPLSDIASEVIHPVFGVSITELKAHCKDAGTVEILR